MKKDYTVLVLQVEENCVIFLHVLFRSTMYQKLYSSGIPYSVCFLTHDSILHVERFTISHLAAWHGQLDHRYICAHMHILD